MKIRVTHQWNNSKTLFVLNTDEQNSRRKAMAPHTNFWTAVCLTVNLSLLTVLACAETPVPSTPPTATATPAPKRPPPSPPTPTLEERRIQTPTDYGYNTRVVDGDIHVWHVPHCRPVPPATFVASVILTDLRSGSHLYLNRDGSVRTSPRPDYRSDEGQGRFAAVLEDSSLMELILTPVECP